MLHLCIIFRDVHTSQVTAAGEFRLNDKTRGTRIFEHVTPGVVRAIICAADRATHVTPHPRWAAGPWATIATRHTARGACVHFSEAGLPLPASHTAA